LTESESMLLKVLPDDGLHGRRKIYTDKAEITPENVAEVISKAYSVHLANKREIQYLYDFYRGKQDIRCRTKSIRPEINNKIMVNRANEIVTFKVSFLLSDPLLYVSRGGDENVSEQINQLNEHMYAEDKTAKDKEVADWMHICGVGVRMVMPDQIRRAEGAPFEVHTLDPREAFVIYYSGLGNYPLAGVLRRRDEDGNELFCVYTPRWYFELRGGDVVKVENRTVPFVPIIEYVNNEARMGAFEVVLPLLNAINTLESNRIDDIEQFVQSIMVFKNCEISGEQAEELKKNLGLMIKSDPSNPADVFRIDGELSQTGAQAVVDDINETILEICGMPNRNGGSSTSDTGAATIMRDGWQAAEARAKDTELLWNRSEREFLRIVLHICRNTNTFNLELKDIGLKFTRRNYEGIQSKAQVLAELLNNSKVHPQIAYQVSGILPDTEEAYRMGMLWYDEQQQKAAKMSQQNMPKEIGEEQPDGEQDEQQEQTA